ncbi:14146_t:CDS:2, partial [Dentiscutata erythropus]
KYMPQKETKTSGQVDECSNSNLTKWATNIGKLMLTEFNEK